ncbi:MAG: hypothetical protein ACRC2J_10340 [Microcoleaceae cyanobacterium]
MLQVPDFWPKTSHYNPTPPNRSPLMDSSVVQAAKKIYLAYAQIHAATMTKPVGVAINPVSYWGKLIFQRKPILLPGEYFIPLEQIESQIY